MDTTVSKLILLYVLDQMEIPVTTETLNEMCCSQNNWLTYMTLTQIIPELYQARFIVSCSSNNTEFFKSCVLFAAFVVTLNKFGALIFRKIYIE